jgi:hypothetical protein
MLANGELLSLGCGALAGTCRACVNDDGAAANGDGDGAAANDDDDGGGGGDSCVQEANGNPATACGGTAAEMVYPGGELAFILRMLEDSVRLGPRVHWCVQQQFDLFICLPACLLACCLFVWFGAQ